MLSRLGLTLTAGPYYALADGLDAHGEALRPQSLLVELGELLVAGEARRGGSRDPAPIFRTVEDEESGEKERVLRSFKVVKVFDVSQTDAAPGASRLPEKPRPRALLGDSDAARTLTSSLLGFCGSEGVPALEALFAGSDELSRFERHRQDTSHVREIMVCTHGSRDACCGKFGYPFYGTLRYQYAAPQATPSSPLSAPPPSGEAR